MKAARFEVHEHWYPAGPAGKRLVHSHEGGDQPHKHPHTGPAAFTIDRDEWLRATGLRGGSRKKFTSKPLGEQLPLVAREPMRFEVIIMAKKTPPEWGAGPGIALPERIAQTFRADYSVHEESERGTPHAGGNA